MTVFHGTKHNDTFDKSSDTSSDTFDLYKGGEDTVIAGIGDDVINMGASLDAGDRLNGGGGRDIVTLHGDYSAGLVFDDQTIQNIEVLRLRAGFDYNLTTADGNVASGERLIVNADQLGAGNHLIFDGSLESDGRFVVYGGAGDDTITGGAKADIFHLEKGGNDTAHGGGGNDTFYLGAAFTASDVIDGGAGNDTLDLGLNNGAASTTFAANTMSNVETLKLDNSMTLILSDGNVAAGQILTVWDTASLGNSVDGSAETDGSFHFIGEQSNREDFFSGGAGNDVFDMGDNSSPMNVLNGNGGDDIFSFNANFSNILSTISGGTGSDTLELNGDYTTLAIRADQGHVLGIETLKFLGGHSYTGISIKGDMAGGSTLTIDASAASNLSIDLSAATSATYAITGSAGADTFKFGSNFSASDTVNGGAGNDTLELNGTYTNYTFAANQLTGIDTLKLDAGLYFFHWNDTDLASGQTLTVDFSALTSGSASFAGSAEQDGNFHFVAGNVGTTTLIGGAGNDTFDMTHFGNGTMALDGGGGNDTFLFGANYRGGISAPASPGATATTR